jgi:phosphoribosylglycinamide formyltransferase 1
MLKLAVLVSGGGTNLQALIDQIEQSRLTGVQIEVVISNKAGVYALTRAKQHGIPSEVILKKDFADKEEFGKALVKLLERYQVDLVVLAGCLLIIPEQVIEAYRYRIINIHPALIPSFCGGGYYGLKVHEAVLARGVKVTGATVHFVDEGTDTGPIILQKAVNVLPGDTPELLQQRVMEQAEWELLPKAVQLIADHRIAIEDNMVTIKE